MKTFFQKLFQFFRSMRFINFLLILLAFAAAFGTFPDSFKFFPFAPGDIFHQGWFLVLLGYLALFSAWYAIQRIVCLVKKNREEGLSSVGKIDLTEPPQNFRVPFHLISTYGQTIIKAVSDQKYDLKIEKKEGTYSILAWKNGWGVWGAPLTHMGFVVVLVGGLVTFLFSDVRDVMIPEGETITLPKSQTKMKLEKFAVLFHSGESKPENYVSHLLVEENGKEITRKDLQVNHPLRIGATKLFQMRYRVEIPVLQMVVYKEERAVERIELKPKEKKRLSQFPLWVQVDEVIPDFVMNKEGVVSSRTPYFKNPAALISLYPRENLNQASEIVWAFQDLVSHKGKEFDEWSFVIEKIKKRYVSGIKLSRDPGVPFAYTGFILLILGGFISGFVVPRRFMLVLKPISNGNESLMEILYPRAKDTFSLQRDLNIVKAKLSKAFEVVRT